MQERTLASKLPYLKLKRFLVEDLGKTVLLKDQRHMECLCHIMIIVCHSLSMLEMHIN